MIDSNSIPVDPYDAYDEWISWGDFLGTGSVANCYREFLSFEDAVKFTRSLNLKSITEWNKYRKSGDKPKDIPTNPNRTYKEEWKGWAYWLGTTTISSHDMEFLPFKEARYFAISLKLQSTTQWREYCNSGKRPHNVPSNPSASYKEEWKGWGDWLGSNTPSSRRDYLPFVDARDFARSLKIETWTEWKNFCKTGKKPFDIPSRPWKIYKTEYKGITDWLGTDHISSVHIQYLSFQEARNYIRLLGLTSAKEWDEYCKSGKKPQNIPAIPKQKYKKEWVSLGDWLGAGSLSDKRRIFWDFEKAREFIRSLDLSSSSEWELYKKSGKRPKNIPSHPNVIYKEEWKGMADWLGKPGGRRRKFRPFEHAIDFVRSLCLKSQIEWKAYCVSGNKPKNIPSHPQEIYSEWKGYRDWLGYETKSKKLVLP